MDISTINIDIQEKINASPQRVFAALTTGINVWWGSPYLENAIATKDLILEAKIGGRFYERWAITGDKQGSLLGTVTAINPPELLRLEGPFGINSDGLAHSKVSFVLQPVESGTLLQFNYQVIGNIDNQRKLKYKREWQDLLSSLKRLIEKGEAEGVVHDPSLSEP